MKLTFSINYYSQWGESLMIVGDIPQLGNDMPVKGLFMEPKEDGEWVATTDLSADVDFSFNYSYVVIKDNEVIRKEWGKPRCFCVDKSIDEYLIIDSWQDMPADKPYYSSAIVDCINHRCERETASNPCKGEIFLKVEAPMIASDEIIAVCGDCSELGNWNPGKSQRMNDSQFPTWTVGLDYSKIPSGTQYKFIILKKDTGEVVEWERGENRRLIFPESLNNAAIIISGLKLNNPLKPWKGTGVAIPVFSLRSDEDFGVGDFMDMKKMIDWAVLTGQNFIQILPINDTTMTHTWCDSYPYNANSTFALHPMYLRVNELGTINDVKRREYFENLRKELNSLSTVDYERVNNAKNEYALEIFHQNGKKDLGTKEYRIFFEKNKEWLVPYAAYCVLRDMNGTPDFYKWGAYAVYSQEIIEDFVKHNANEINFIYYLQFHLDRQLKEVRDYAHKHKIAIKGDIPIGISRTSVDAWISPQLFNLNSQAGAPPDDFSVLGQNWGFPTYNWEEMSKDGFSWWRARLRKMSEYFDAYRIDHLLGFFRIWQIPMNAVHGLLGTFYRALPFSVDELCNSYDFRINIHQHTRPYIADWFLSDIFGDYTEEAKKFLIPCGEGLYVLKKEFNTQKKVVDYFAKQPATDKNIFVCEAILGVLDNVLFIEDPVEKAKYHPRISAQQTYVYKSLSDYEKWCFNRLYNDFFYQRNNHFWQEKAMWKLPPLIDATNMLTCGEDLGMIPECVPAVMDKLEILSLEIQRMPKDTNSEFGNTWAYPYFSVCTTSTHDMSGIRQWWKDNPEKTQRFFNQILHENGKAPEYAGPWICEKIVDLHLKSPSMLCILPLQDWLSMSEALRHNNPLDEQINIPANPRHYWRYRMHISIENLLLNVDFNKKIRSMILESGRN